MNTKTIDIANIVLMVLSAVLAFALPFELFLFSYAVLGPLHYLTEITWLKKRDYFTNGKSDYYLLVVPCLVLTFIVLVTTYNNLPVINGVYEFCISFFGESFTSFSNVMIFFAFVTALAFVMFKDTFSKVVYMMVALFVGILVQHNQGFLILFAIFLPTLIHVFIFTGLFILQGAFKNKSTTGFISVIVFIVCGLSFFIWKPVFNFYNISEYAKTAVWMEGKGFINVNATFINLFNMGKVTMETLFQSSVGLSVARFVAFAYTYHYLNWFSKTSVIKWHKVPKNWLATVIILWVLSVALYAYNYKTGLMALYFLSMLHVFLEFPLNFRSMVGIRDSVKALISKPGSVKQAGATR